MSEEKPRFGLLEKGEFSRENLEKELIGKIVHVTAQGTNISSIGRLVHYVSGEIAVLKPFILTTEEGFKEVDDTDITYGVGNIYPYGCETFEEAYNEFIAFQRNNVRPETKSEEKAEKPKKK